MIHQRHRQTDGQTDDMRSQDRALHYSASRGKNYFRFKRSAHLQREVCTVDSLMDRRCVMSLMMGMTRQSVGLFMTGNCCKQDFADPTIMSCGIYCVQAYTAKYHVDSDRSTKRIIAVQWRIQDKVTTVAIVAIMFLPLSDSGNS